MKTPTSRPQNLWKPLLVTLLAVLGLCTSARADITTALRAYYTLDEASGLTAADSTGLSPSAMLFNFNSDPAQWVAGWTNGALQFDATQYQYATIDDSTNGLNFAVMANPAFTLAVWVRGAAGVSQSAGAGIITRGYGAGGEQYMIDVYNNYYRFAVRDGSGAANTIMQSIPSLRCDGSWQFLVGVFDSTLGANQLKFYVNGQVAYQQNGPASLLNNAHAVSLGAREGNSSSGYTLPFAGTLDDVRFYGRALSASDVLELYNAFSRKPEIVTQPQGATNYVGDTAVFSVVVQGTAPFSYQWRFNETNLIANATNASCTLANLQLTNAGGYDVVITNLAGSVTSTVAVLAISNPPADVTSGLVAYFTLDQSTGSLATDASGSTGGANIQNFTTDSQWAPSGGRTNGAYNLPGLTSPSDPISGQYLDISDTTNALDFSSMATPALSVAAWIKTPPGFNEPPGVGLVAKGYGRGGEQYVLDLYNNGPRFFVKDPSGNAYFARGDTAGIMVNNGAWTHLVGVLDPTLSPPQVKLFVNGQPVSYGNAPSTLMGPTGDTTIGARQDSGVSGYNLPFTGLMDDVRIYNRALTPADVQALYAAVGTAAPFWVVPLVNTTNYLNSATLLSVAADGTAPLSYQWQWYGTNVPGATTASFSIASSQTNNSGPYSVVVTNLYGSITSSAYLAIGDLSPTDYTSTLVAEWNFDESSGTTAADSAGTNVLNLFNFPADGSQWVTTARIGSHALRFNAVADDINGGTNDYCQTAGGLRMPVNYDLYTFAFWCKLDSTTYGANPRVITPTIRPWVLWSAAGGMRVYNATGGAVPLLNKWTHYVLTYDRPNRLYSCYVNGVKTVTNATVETKTAPSASTLWKVGHNEGASDGDYFRGQLDDVRVYNRRLTDSQAAALYASAPPFFQIGAQPQPATAREREPATFSAGVDASVPVTLHWQKNGVDIPGATNVTLNIPYASMADNGAIFRLAYNSSVGSGYTDTALLTVTPLPAADLTNNLVLYYAFDETSGDVAHDSSGHGNDGTLYNWAAGAGKWEPGILGNALHFNGGPFNSPATNNNYLLTPAMSSANGLADGNNFTFAFWAKLDPANPTFNNPRFFATANTASWVIWERSSAPTGIGFWHGAGANPAPEAAVWHHYVVSFDRVRSSYNVYEDGVRQVWQGLPSNPATEVDPTGYAWVIGHRENITPENNTESFMGWLDDVRLYNRQFSVNDAEALYQAANVPPRLSIKANGTSLTFSWPSWASGYTLKASTRLGASASWSPAPGTPVLVDATLYQTNSIGTGTSFFRLVK